MAMTAVKLAFPETSTPSPSEDIRTRGPAETGELVKFYCLFDAHPRVPVMNTTYRDPREGWPFILGLVNASTGSFAYRMPISVHGTLSHEPLAADFHAHTIVSDAFVYRMPISTHGTLSHEPLVADIHSRTLVADTFVHPSEWPNPLWFPTFRTGVGGYAWRERLAELRTWIGEVRHGEAQRLSEAALQIAERLCLYAEYRMTMSGGTMATVLAPLSDGGVHVEWTSRATVWSHLEIGVPAYPTGDLRFSLLRTEESPEGRILWAKEVGDATESEVFAYFESLLAKTTTR